METTQMMGAISQGMGKIVMRIWETYLICKGCKGVMVGLGIAAPELLGVFRSSVRLLKGTECKVFLPTKSSRIHYLWASNFLFITQSFRYVAITITLNDAKAVDAGTHNSKTQGVIKTNSTRELIGLQSIFHIR